MAVSNVQFKRVTGPTSPVISLAEVKQDLRVLSTFFDELIQSHIDAAVSELDGPSGLANRCLGVSTYEVFLRSDASVFSLNVPDLVELVSAHLIDPLDFTVTDVTGVAIAARHRSSFKLSGYPNLYSEDPNTPNVKLVVRMGLSPIPAIAKAAIKLRVRQLWAGDNPETEKALKRALSAFRLPPSFI